MRKSNARLIDPGTVLSIPIVLSREQSIRHMPVSVENIQDTGKRGVVLVSLKKIEEEKT